MIMIRSSYDNIVNRQQYSHSFDNERLVKREMSTFITVKRAIRQTALLMEIGKQETR